MWGRWSATILSIFLMTVMLGSIIAVTMPSLYVQGSDEMDIIANNTDSIPASFSRTSSPVSEGDVLVIDPGAGMFSRGALFSVDPSTGNHTIISDF